MNQPPGNDIPPVNNAPKNAAVQIGISDDGIVVTFPRAVDKLTMSPVQAGQMAVALFACASQVAEMILTHFPPAEDKPRIVIPTISNLPRR